MKFLTIRTRLMIMLLFVSLLACGVLGFLGSQYGEQVITKEVTDQLRLVRVAKKSQIETYLRSISNLTEVMGQNETVIQATKEFKQAFQKLGNDKLNADCSKALADHYHQFLDRLMANVDAKPDLNTYMPKTVEGCYLQFEYIVDNKNKIGEKDKLLDADDGSEYTRIHRNYHEFFSKLIKTYGFYDVFLIDLDRGDIVYSAYKETDFATNLFNGPYQSSNLAELTRKLKANSDLQSAIWMDFASYRPSYGAPAAFVGVPLSEAGQSIGALVLQLPISKINNIMTGNFQWQEDGLGESGETYLVGEDMLMRSVSRFFVEDSVAFRDLLIDKDIEEEKVKRMFNFGTTILQQRINTPAVKEALEGNSGVMEIEDYRGEKVMSAYAPVNLGDLRYAILAEKDSEEAFRPVREFNQRMFIQTIVLMLIVTLLAMWMANRFVKPIEEISKSADKITQGDLSHRVNIDSRDEFGTLATSFNKMVSEIEKHEHEMEDKTAYTEKLLLNFIPKEFADRLQKGEKGFADDYQNLSLIVVDLVGFGDLTAKVGGDRSVQYLNEIVDAFDQAAIRSGIEKIRTVGDTYFAACGLFQARLDHPRRAAQYAGDVSNLISQFNLNHGTQIKTQVALHTGHAVAGIVGHDQFSFDVWSEDVSQLYHMNEMDFPEEIVVSKEFADRVSEFYTFEHTNKKTRKGADIYRLTGKSK